MHVTRQSIRRCCAAICICLEASLSTTGGIAASQPPLASSRVLARAEEWFYRFQSGNIDRSQLDAEMSGEVSASLIRRESTALGPYGRPLSFRYISSGPIRGTKGYAFLIKFNAGAVLELIAFDESGKIAGIDFETYAPRSA